MLLGKADALLAERARMALADTLAPIFALVAEPLTRCADALDDMEQLWSMRSENAACGTRTKTCAAGGRWRSRSTPRTRR